MKAYLLIIFAITLGIFKSVLGQSVSASSLDQEVVVSTPILGQTSQKVKLKVGEVHTWQVDLINKKPQTLHLYVKKRFRLGSLLKVFTPFAAATVIDRYSTASHTSVGETLISSRTAPVNVSAGLLAAIGTHKSFRQKFGAKLILSYLNKDGSILRTTTHTIPTGKPVGVVMTNCVGVEKVSAAIIVTTESVKVTASTTDSDSQTSSNQSEVKVNDEPCNGDGGDEGGPDYNGEFYDTPDDGDDYGNIGGIDPVKFPSSLTNPKDGETMTDQNGIVITYSAEANAWVIPNDALYPPDRDGATIGTTIPWLYASGEVVLDATLTAAGWILVVATSVSGDTSPTQYLSKGGNRNIWPDQFGYPPNVKNVDWDNNSDDELAEALADEFGETDRGGGSAYNLARKWFRDKRPKGPRK